MKISVDIVSDVICPWCFLGKRRLDKALAASAEDDIEFAGGRSSSTHRFPRKACRERTILSGNLARNDWLTSTRRSWPRLRLKGYPTLSTAIAVTPNTLDAHRLIRWSHDAGKQHEMAERLFRLYWSEGGDIGKRDVLIKAVVDVGLDATLVSQLLVTEADLDAVIKEVNEAAELGISGVPTFIFGNRYAVVGAQPSEVLGSAISRVRLEQKAATR